MAKVIKFPAAPTPCGLEDARTFGDVCMVLVGWLDAGRVADARDELRYLARDYGGVLVPQRPEDR